jgi:DNA-binding transcriptional ArsR family regulator
MVTQQFAPDVFHAVSDVTRRAILDRLRDGAKPVNELARAFPISRPAISKHLRVLYDANLVTERRDGRHRLYRLNPEPLRDLDTWLQQYRHFWAVNLLSLKKHVESQAKNKEKKP